MNIESKADAGKERVSRVLSRAEAIIVQSEEGRERLQELIPGRMDRVYFVPKSFVWLGEETLDLRASCNFNPGDVVFFMPAGIRPVKGNLECLLGFERIHALRTQAKIVFAGAPLDEAYAERFCREAERLRVFARWVAPIHPAAMRAAYRSVDVILNGSASEGLSNVLIEARAAGRPLLASDIPGNRWPVLGDPGDSPMGLLFGPSDRADFIEKALRLIDDATLRRELGEAGAAYARRMRGPCDEARALVKVYEAAMGRRSFAEVKKVPECLSA
jgi:glycosyltransferase involved in cell wall biosynthesis